MHIRDSILDCIGDTPMVRLSRFSEGLGCVLLAKLDHLNPGGSVKDRIGIAMIRDAEQKGLLKPGATITEGTAGNTGLGLAIAANVLGYKCVFCLPDKMSREKIDLLRAYGARVVVTPTAVNKDDPRHYSQVARRIAEETPGGFFAGQFQNPANPEVHYQTTAREIWEQTEGTLTHFFATAGTGGTVSGVGRLIKEKNPDAKVILCDPDGSYFVPYFRDPTAEPKERQYTVEGIGLDYIPATLSFEHVDDALSVTDAEAYAAARKLTRIEGIFTGGSSGTALAGAIKWIRANPLGPEAVPVVFLCDVGDRYLSKMYNDDWMRENELLEQYDLTTGEMLLQKQAGQKLVTASPEQSLAEVMAQVKSLDLSQIPVLEAGEPVGALYDEQLLKLLLEGRKLEEIKVCDVMGAPLPIVDEETSASELLKLFESSPAALVRRVSGEFGIITKADLVAAL